MRNTSGKQEEFTEHYKIGRNRMIHQIQTKMGTVKLPCMEPVLVPIEKVQANNYNPNNVSSDNMRLLLQSILDNGFCFPVVTIYDDLMDKYVIIDGFHRYQIFRD